VADFSQLGVVPTLHDLHHRSVADLESELRLWTAERPAVLIIPCLASEIGSAALAAVLAELRSADWLARIVIGLDQADETQCRTAQRLLGDLPQRCDVLWNDSPAMARVEEHLGALGLAPRDRGKGRNVWYCLGMVLAGGTNQVIAMHDADIIGYRRDLLARLVYPVAHPDFGYCFAKGYYHRVTDGRFGGRVTRLLVAPLVRALRDEIGEDGYLRYLEAFRYPLAGETAMEGEMASGLRIPGHWGMDIGILSDIYAHCDLSSICQVSVAGAYDHKHQGLSANDATAGLRRMSIDVAATIIRRLGVESLDGSTSLCDAYRAAARDLVHHYANDAAINGYVVDPAAEMATAEVFARSIDDALQACKANPRDSELNPSWHEVLERAPQVAPMLLDAARHAAR
jgi:glucosyl-3-phosphoglycerate synthase